MPRLPEENVYVTRCCVCHKLILMNGNELLQVVEVNPTWNKGYKFKCPGCNGKTSHTTTELLSKISNENDQVINVPWNMIGHPFIIDEP